MEKGVKLTQSKSLRFSHCRGSEVHKCKQNNILSVIYAGLFLPYDKSRDPRVRRVRTKVGSKMQA
jgi:hypothetical protein